eukprot:9145900-Pyramimonas_sp.AAC.1
MMDGQLSFLQISRGSAAVRHKTKKTPCVSPPHKRGSTKLSWTHRHSDGYSSRRGIDTERINATNTTW